MTYEYYCTLIYDLVRNGNNSPDGIFLPESAAKQKERGT